MRNIVLIGFMGSGKSSVGRVLAELLNMTFVDTDAVIEANAGCSISEIFHEQNERFFRKLERDAVKRISNNSDQVIACGGGVILDPENTRNLRRNGIIIYLETDPEVIVERTKDTAERPLLDIADKELEIQKLMRKRQAKYQDAADISINTSDLSVNEVVNEVVKRIEGDANEGG